jgi:hypothetical protein
MPIHNGRKPAPSVLRTGIQCAGHRRAVARLARYAIRLNLEIVAVGFVITALMCSLPGRLKKPISIVFAPRQWGPRGAAVTWSLPEAS